MKITLVPAFVLHKRPFRETSLILDVLTRDYGRLKVLAKGIKSKKRSQAGFVQLYHPILISLLNSRSDLYVMTEIESYGPSYQLLAHACLCGLYLNELLVKLLPLEQAEPEIFLAYQEALVKLQGQDNHEAALRLFEKHLLTHLGYGLALTQNAETGLAIDPDDYYYYREEVGLLPWRDGQTRPRISGKSIYQFIAEQDFELSALSEIKQMMRGIIHFHLAGKPIRSRELFRVNFPDRSVEETITK